MAAISATMLWSRVAGLERVAEDDRVKAPAEYVAQDAIISTRATMSAKPLLYIVLLLHPLISFVALMALILTSDSPISSGFDITAILSGVDASTLSILKGAGFSGALIKKVRMQIAVEQRGGILDNNAFISYQLGGRAPNSRLTGVQKKAHLH